MKNIKAIVALFVAVALPAAAESVCPACTSNNIPPAGLVIPGVGPVGAANPVPVAISGAITITGPIAVTQSTSPWVVSNGGTFAVQATLAAETTKVIGTVNQGTSPWVVSVASLPLPSGAATSALQSSVQGTVAPGTAATNAELGGCVYNSTEPSPTTGQGLATQCDAKGRGREVIMDAAGNTRGANVNASNQLSVSVDNAPVLGAGSAVVGKVSVDQTTPGTTNAVQEIPGTSGGLSIYFVQPTASDNHAVIKAGAGQVYKISVTNNSATINYLRLYDATTGFNGCNSATNLKYKMAIPASASSSGAGYSDPWPTGIAFTTGISICVTSGYATNDTTNATASAMDVNVGYK